MDLSQRAALLLKFAALQAGEAASAAAEVAEALPALARSVEAVEHRFNLAVEGNSAVGIREWSFMHGGGRESEESSLLELLVLAEVAPGLMINSCERNLSLRLSDALRGTGEIWELHREGRRARRELAKAEQRLNCAQRAVKWATAQEDAARKCSDLVTRSEEVWVSCGREMTSCEVKRLVQCQELPPSTVLRGPGSVVKTAREVIESMESSARAAQQIILACPGYKEIVSLDPCDPEICCWGWTVSGVRHGPYSLKDLRCWVRMGSVQSEGLISHSSQPDRYATIREVLFFLELQELAFWLDVGQGRRGPPTHHRFSLSNGCKNGGPSDKIFNPMDFINSLAKPKVSQTRNLSVQSTASIHTGLKKPYLSTELPSCPSSAMVGETEPDMRDPGSQYDRREGAERKGKARDSKSLPNEPPKSHMVAKDKIHPGRKKKKVVLSLFRAAEQRAVRKPPGKPVRVRKGSSKGGNGGRSNKLESLGKSDVGRNGAHIQRNRSMHRSLARNQQDTSEDSKERSVVSGSKHRMPPSLGMLSGDSQPPGSAEISPNDCAPFAPGASVGPRNGKKRTAVETVKATKKPLQTSKSLGKLGSLYSQRSLGSPGHMAKKRKVSMGSKVAVPVEEARIVGKNPATCSQEETSCGNSGSIHMKKSSGWRQSYPKRSGKKRGDDVDKLGEVSQNVKSSTESGKSSDVSNHGASHVPTVHDVKASATPRESASFVKRMSHESRTGISEPPAGSKHRHEKPEDVDVGDCVDRMEGGRSKKSSCAVEKCESDEKDDTGQGKSRTQVSGSSAVDCVMECSVSSKPASDGKGSPNLQSSMSPCSEKEVSERSRLVDESSILSDQDKGHASGSNRVDDELGLPILDKASVSKSKSRSERSGNMIAISHTTLPEEPSEATQSDLPYHDKRRLQVRCKGTRSEQEEVWKKPSGEEVVEEEDCVEEASCLEVHERIHMLMSDLKTPSFAATPSAGASPQHCENLNRINKLLCDLQTPVVSGSLAGTPAPDPGNTEGKLCCSHSAHDKESVRKVSERSESGMKDVGERSRTPGWTGAIGDMEGLQGEVEAGSERSEKVEMLMETGLVSGMGKQLRGYEDEDAGSLSDVPLAKRRELWAKEGSQEKPKEVKRRVKQANRKRIPIVATKPSRPGPKTKRAIRYATPSATPSLQTFQSTHNRGSNSRTITAGTSRKRSSADDGFFEGQKDICARNLVYNFVVKLKKRRRAEVVAQDPGHSRQVDTLSSRGETRNRALRIESRQVVKSDVADASKWKNTVARGQTLRLGRSPVHAWGLFATERIEPEVFVIEYTGQVIRKVVSEIREKQYEADGLGSSYLFRLDDEHVVDATKQGGLARFINHSCDPNCYTKIITVDGQKKIGIYSRRPIWDGEELFYDYKFDYEEEGKRVSCHCGAKNCRGFMN